MDSGEEAKDFAWWEAHLKGDPEFMRNWQSLLVEHENRQAQLAEQTAYAEVVGRMRRFGSFFLASAAGGIISALQCNEHWGEPQAFAWGGLVVGFAYSAKNNFLKYIDASDERDCL